MRTLGVEASRLTRDVRGIGRYVRALLPRLLAQRPELELWLFVQGRRHRQAVERLVAETPALAACGARVRVRPLRQLARSGADVCWYPWNIARPLPVRGAVVATVHDVAPVAHPDPRWLRWRKNFRWRRLYRATAASATAIVTPSRFTADEVTRVLGVPSDRLFVTPLAADDFTAPATARDADALARLGVRAPFVLVVGASERRKNLPLAERAMRRVVADHPGLSMVLAGPRRDRRPGDAAVPWMHTLGFVTEEDLATLYRTTEVLVVPSTYEGFGLPMLEAMRLGAPVIALRASSLPEVGGDAAVWVDAPDDDAALAAAIDRLLRDPSHREALRRAGPAHVARFAWDETARLTMAAFDEAARRAPVAR